MIDFGKRVKDLRLEQRITKEEFCGDESELSVRQLTRIESGTSMPTLAKVEFIAERLGVKIGDLTDPERFELPKRYKELKFLLLRTQTYLEAGRIAKRGAYLDEIFDTFYDDLPEEEQLIVEILQSRLDIIKKISDFSAKKILDDYLEQIKLKTVYNLNDLILVDLYAMYVSYKGHSPEIYDNKTHQHIVNVLLENDKHLQIDELFILAKAISATASNCIFLNDKDNLKRLFLKMENLMVQLQDFHKAPVLNLLKWKYYLMEGNQDLAQKHYLDACTFSSLTNDNHLTAKLKEEWERDMAKLADRT